MKKHDIDNITNDDEFYNIDMNYINATGIYDTNISNITSSDTQTITINSSTINNYYPHITTGTNIVDFNNSITIPSVTTNVVYNNYDYSDNINDFIFEQPKEFENCMPSIDTLKEMSELYPGFKKAFDNFQTMYNLVKEEYELQKKVIK